MPGSTTRLVGTDIWIALARYVRILLLACVVAMRTYRRAIA